MRQFYEFGWYQVNRPAFGREEFQRRLETNPGLQLVIVRYTPGHKPFEEWVYNEAEIERAKVVWVRELPRVDNRGIINTFRGRRTWILEADAHPPRLLPYELAEITGGESP